MWITVIQGPLLDILSYQPFNWVAILTSRIMCSLIDLSFVEPCFCRGGCFDLGVQLRMGISILSQSFSIVSQHLQEIASLGQFFQFSVKLF
jgi:hypothetical protein